MRAWPHRALYGVAFGLWVVSLFSVIWLAPAAGVWLLAHGRGMEYGRILREQRSAERKAEWAAIEKMVRGSWQARRLEVEITPGWS